MKTLQPYTPEILANVCPQCCAAVTGKCLEHKPTGGMQYLEFPHTARVLLAEMKSRALLATDLVLGIDNAENDTNNLGTPQESD